MDVEVGGGPGGEVLEGAGGKRGVGVYARGDGGCEKKGGEEMA